MIEVYDRHHDLDRNVIVRPEMRGRFLRLEPLPAPPLHSHDLAGEMFLVLEGCCEFIVEEERVTCGAGQLIYVDKTVPHSLHAVGGEPCVLYLSLAPHVEPTHTFYDGHRQKLPLRYDAWKGPRFPDGSAEPSRAAADPAFMDGTLAGAYMDGVQELAERTTTATRVALERRDILEEAIEAGDLVRAKGVVDAMWGALHDLLVQVSVVEGAWNALVPHVMTDPD